LHVPYDKIISIRDISLPGFLERQEKASKASTGILSEITVNKVWDLGCGSGEITNKLASRFPDKQFIGIDVSKKSLDIAKKNSTHTPNIKYKCATINSIIPGNNQNEIVLSVGNTLIHFGEKKFGRWLGKLKKTNHLPAYIFLDFINDWDDIVKKGNDFNVCTSNINNKSFFLAGINTVRIGKRIVRELITIDGNNSSKNKKIVTNVAPVEQYADQTESYFTHLKNCTYSMIKEIEYEHGYGTMKGSLWILKKR
jgi:2-polyprenyl-3-methyl-5-hydroxy-6-metoxy-1,4-benzoquinol methylase